MPLETIVLGESYNSVPNKFSSAQVVETALTPTIVPTISTTPAIILTPTTIPTLIPTLIPIPTSTPVSTPTSIPTTNPSPTPTPMPPRIESPYQNQSLNTSRPAFTGRGNPGEVLNITIESGSKIITQVTVQTDGTWNYVPVEDINEGNHTISVAQKGGVDTRNFTILGTSQTKGGIQLEPPGSTEAIFILLGSTLLAIGGLAVFLLL